MVQAERLAAIGQTIAALSHHIKNILQGLRSGSEILKMGLAEKDDELLEQGWTIVEKNQGKIYDLVMDMLSYSKEREPAIEQTDLNDVVRDVVELLEGRARELGIKLESRWTRALPHGPVDPEGIHRALLNIVGNALDAVEERGRARVWRSHPPGGGRRLAAHRGSRQRRRHPAGKLEDIFKPFVSTKGSKGTGPGPCRSAARSSASTAATSWWRRKQARGASSSSGCRSRARWPRT